MNCCDHNCNQGRDCPTRQACELPITMEDDEPIITFDKVVDYIISLLAGVGLLATIILTAFLMGYAK